jgi:hypothetical protein
MRIIDRAPLAANVNANTGAVQIIPTSVNGVASLAPAVVNLLGSGRFVGKQFRLRASGFLTTDQATTTAAITLYANVGGVPAANPLAAASWTVIKASTARVVNTTSAPWTIESMFCWDAISKKLHGTTAHLVNLLYDAHAANTNALAALDNTAEPVVAFAIGVTFAVNLTAANVGGLTEFVLGY